MDRLAEEERAKYQAMWARLEYRRYSPGEDLVETAIEALGMKAGESVIDYGCGTGRAAKKFEHKGFIVRGVDFVAKALETDVPFSAHCLWDLPAIDSDWAFCSDVMEHISTEMVGAVLAGIANRTTRGAFFQISTVPDGLGSLIGKVLHLTVRPAGWWANRLKRHWSEVRILSKSGGSQKSNTFLGAGTGFHESSTFVGSHTSVTFACA